MIILIAYTANFERGEIYNNMHCIVQENENIMRGMYSYTWVSDA